jgi:Nif-specific regulatory protein
MEHSGDSIQLQQARAERDFFRRVLELDGNDDIVPLIEEALALIVEVTGAQQGFIELGDPDRSDPRSRFQCARACTEETVESIRARLSRGVIAEAIASGATVRSACALTDPRFEQKRSVRRHAIGAVLCAPVGALPPIGVVYLQGRSEPGPFSAEDQLRAELLARHLAPLADRLVIRRGRFDRGDETLDVRRQFRCDAIIGRSHAIAAVLRQAALVAPLELSVLLTGPSGTGKSAIARVIADNSARAHGPFLEVNCAALPEALLENELFGAVRGAHSAAHQRLPGKLEAAKGGTIFLDEIAELGLAAQAKLLHLVQAGSYFPLGSSEPVAANVRIIAATNVDLQQAVAERRFRDDLFYRLHVLPLRMPSLDERSEDIAALAEHFARAASSRHGLPYRGLSRAAVLACEDAAWPGNVRQLAHSVEAALVRAHGDGSDTLEIRHLFPEEAAVGRAQEATSFQQATRAFHRRLLAGALAAHDWNVSAAARALDLTRSHMYNLIHAHGLQRNPEPPQPAHASHASNASHASPEAPAASLPTH